MKILLVDDDRGFRESVARALESRGHFVDQATTYQGVEERLVLDGEEYQAVVTDWDLGLLSDHDGDSVVRLVKTLCPTTGVLIWSGLTRTPVPDADAQLVKSDIDEFLDWIAYESSVQEGE